MCTSLVPGFRSYGNYREGREPFKFDLAKSEYQPSRPALFSIFVRAENPLRIDPPGMEARDRLISWVRAHRGQSAPPPTPKSKTNRHEADRLGGFLVADHTPRLVYAGREETCLLIIRR